MPRAATELAKEWRTDRALRRLEALIAVVDAEHTLLVSGTGDVIQPTDGILGIGSGGNYAVAAARALVAHTDLSAAEIVRDALEIAADICVYSNRNIVIEELRLVGQELTHACMLTPDAPQATRRELTPDRSSPNSIATSSARTTPSGPWRSPSAIAGGGSSSTTRCARKSRPRTFS